MAAAISPLVSWLFDSPVAGQIALVTAGLIVLNSLTNVPDALLQRCSTSGPD